MSDFNSSHNRMVCVDEPAAELDRADAFYAAVLGIAVHREKFGDHEFSVPDHKDGNGGCLIKVPEVAAHSPAGMLVYFNAEGRIRDAVAKAERPGGRILEPVHAIGPHGFRAVLLDSEGNRIALHSSSDA
jgi:predicted enzyme related to lactoylglutathione lyase